MKQRNTPPFSVSPHNAEKANGFAAQIPEALLLLAGFMALGAGLAATWSGYGWLCLLVGAAAACWQCAARQLWRGWAGVALPLLILLAAAILSRSVLAGCVSVCRTICTRWTEMTGRITLPPDGEAGNPLLFACLTAALLGVLCAEAVRLSRTACAIVLTAFLSVLLLLLRPERAENWMALCLFAALFLLTGSIRQNVTGFLSKGGLLLAAGLLAAVLLAVPAMRSGNVFSAWRAESAAALHRLRYERGASVLPEGNFAAFSGDAAEQTPCLTVTMEQPTALYLRGFTGERFTGTGWETMDRQTQSAQKDLMYWMHKRGFYPQMQLFAAANGLLERCETQAIQIENNGACSAWEYVPYGLAAIPVGSSLTADSLEEALAPAKGLRGIRKYQFAMLAAPEQTAEQTLATLTEQPDAARSYRSLEGSYRSAVQARELELPAETRAQLAPMLDEICKEYGAADELTPGEAQLCALRFLEQIGTLRDSGAALPLDDLVKDTTYQTATLTVLTLRYYGLPARYAEGFVLTQETAARTAPGGTVTLTAGNAQAWAEVYQDGIGWMPLALTPGYGTLTDALSSHRTQTGGQADDGDGPGDALPQAETAEETTEEDTPQEQQPDETGRMPQETAKRWLWLLPVGIFLLLLAALAIRYALSHKKRERRLNAAEPRQAITWTAYELARLWPAMGEPYHGGSLFALSEAIGPENEAYAAAIRELAELNGAARFSSRAMTPEQAERAREVWRETLLRLRKTCRPLRRYWMKWIRCLY